MNDSVDASQQCCDKWNKFLLKDEAAQSRDSVSLNSEYNRGDVHFESSKELYKRLRPSLFATKTDYYDEANISRTTDVKCSTVPKNKQGNLESRQGICCTGQTSGNGTQLRVCNCNRGTETRVDSREGKFSSFRTQQCVTLASWTTNAGFSSVYETFERDIGVLASEECQPEFCATKPLLETMSQELSLRESMKTSNLLQPGNETSDQIQELQILTKNHAKENLFVIGQEIRGDTSPQGITRAIPKTASELPFTEVIPGLKLQLSIGQEVSDMKPQSAAFSDVSLELNIGALESRGKDGNGDINSLRSETPKKRRSGFSKWQRPNTDSISSTSVQSICVPDLPMKYLISDSCQRDRLSVAIKGCGRNADKSENLEFQRHEMGIPYDLEIYATETPAVRTKPVTQETALSSTVSQVGMLMAQGAAFDNTLDESVVPCTDSYTALGIPFEACDSTLGVLMAKAGIHQTLIGVPLVQAGTHGRAMRQLTLGETLEGSSVNSLPNHFPSMAWAQSLNCSDIISLAKVETPESPLVLKVRTAADEVKVDSATSESEMEIEDSEVTMLHNEDAKEPPAIMMELDYLKYQDIVKMPSDIPSIQDAAVVEFLRAKKLQREHFLDQIIVNADVYQKHPWHHSGGDVRGYSYFCCNTKYSMRGNMTRDRMTREGGRWKQQGMVHPILNVKEDDAALKTYMSYIPCGKNILKGDFVPNTPGRVKHRHRMIEIALEEDLKLEKLFFKFKVAPKPFLVVCILKKA